MIGNVFGPGGGAGISLLEHIDLSAQIDGNNQIFTIKPYKRASLIVIYNGLIQLPSDVTILSNSSFRLTITPELNTRLTVIIQPL